MGELIIYSIIFFIFGTVFGSFFNVVAYRLPNNMSLVKPDSHCPKCKHKLSRIELIPIISYILQGGKCKHCKTRIAIFYPIFELFTGLLFALSYILFGTTPMLILSLIMVSTCLIIILSDYKYMIIPDEVVIVSVVMLFVFRVVIYSFSISIILDMLIPFIIMLLLKLLGDFMFKKESLGGGDIKLMLIFGLAMGWKMALVSIFLGAIIAFPISLYILLRNKKHELPFGPYLCIAALIIIFFKIDFNFIVNLLI